MVIYPRVDDTPYQDFKPLVSHVVQCFLLNVLYFLITLFSAAV